VYSVLLITFSRLTLPSPKERVQKRAKPKPSPKERVQKRAKLKSSPLERI